jgi:hypothetical protein
MFMISVGSVMFLSACKEAEAPTHEATATSAPATTAAKAAPAIVVSAPRSGDEVTVPVTVKGTASVFEGTVVIAVENADGSKTFCKTFTTASEGAPGTGAFETQIAFPPPSESTQGASGLAKARKMAAFRTHLGAGGHLGWAARDCVDSPLVRRREGGHRQRYCKRL